VLEGLKELRAVHAPIVGMTLSLVNEAQASRHAYERYGYDRAKYNDYYVS
jgi:polysaccharide biosynthesis transport protein